jgi:RNA polymerase sigma-70 factor (ECF subfamily)
MGTYSHSNLIQNTVESTRDWTAVVACASAGGIEQLHQVFYASLLSFYSRRGYAQDASDLAMNTLMGTARSIRRGEIKDPNRLPAYVRSVAIRCLATAIEASMRSRSRECEVTPNLASTAHTPEELAIQDEQTKLVSSVMRSIPCREREVLTRFYVDGQSKEEICEQLQLTDDQFRNMKSRAKIRVTSMVRSATARSSAAAVSRRPNRRAA